MRPESSSAPRVAVIGGGRWGWNLVTNLHALGALEAVVDGNADVRDRVRVELGGVRTMRTATEVFESDISAVVIATPAATHAELAVQALRAGKDVFVEKPFAMNTDDAELVVKESEAATRILMVGHLLLYQPAIRFLKDYLDSGAIGRVCSFHQERLNLGTVRTVENALWSLGVHDVAVILHLASSEPLRIAAWGQRIVQPDVDDDMYLHMEFASGIEGHIHASWMWPERRRRLSVIGTDAMVVYDEGEQRLELRKRRVHADLSTWDGGAEELFIGDPKPLRHELAHFLECVRTRGRPRSDGASAVTVVKVLEQSARQLRGQFET